MSDTYWFELTALEPPPQRNYEVDPEDWRCRARRDRLRPALARRAATEARRAQAVALGIRDGVAALEFAPQEALTNVRVFADAAHALGLKLVVQTGAYDLTQPFDEGLPKPASPMLSEAQLRAQGADEVVQFRPRRAPVDRADALRNEADRIDAELRARHLLDRQVYTVLDTRFALEVPQNEWQEDADWLTGLYAAAMCFALGVTGEECYEAQAREACEALLELSTVSGVPGVVARQVRRWRPADVKAGRKRWHEAPNGRDWWSGDTSRDQLSGHFLGLAVFYDLLEDEKLRDRIRTVVRDTVDRVIEGGMWLRDPDGSFCTHANYFVATLCGLAILKTAYHMTGEARFQEQYLRLIDPHAFLAHAMRECGRQQDPFFQHYQQDSPLYHLLSYEHEPVLKQAYARCLRALHPDSLGNGNCYHLVAHAAFQPETGKAALVRQELAAFSELQLSVPMWRERVAAALAGDDPALGDALRRSLRALLDGTAEGLDPDALYVPMRWRPPMEFGWQYHRHGLPGTHGPYTRYSGVDYLIAFWMGRYHGVV